MSAQDAWQLACEAYIAADDDEIVRVLGMAEHDRTPQDWLLLAVIAMEQGDLDPRTVTVRR